MCKSETKKDKYFTEKPVKAVRGPPSGAEVWCFLMSLEGLHLVKVHLSLWVWDTKTTAPRLLSKCFHILFMYLSMFLLNTPYGLWKFHLYSHWSEPHLKWDTRCLLWSNPELRWAFTPDRALWETNSVPLPFSDPQNVLRCQLHITHCRLRTRTLLGSTRFTFDQEDVG